MQATVRCSIRCLFLTLFLFFLAGVLRLEAQFSSRINVSNSPSDSLASQIAIDRQTGKVHTVWADDPDLLDDSDIFYSNSSDGTSFSSPVDLSRNLPLSAISFFPQIAIDGRGNIHVVWSTLSISANGVFFTRSSDGGATFSAPINLSGSAGLSAAPQIEVDSQGNVNVVWHTPTSNFGPSDILFTRSSNGGLSFSAPLNLTATLGGLSDSARLAVDNQGNINVIWDNSPTDSAVPSGGEIFFSRSTDGMSFSTPVNVSNNSGFSRIPEIAVDDLGNIYSTWQDGSVADSEIFFSRSTDGVNFSTPINLSATNTGTSVRPQLAVDGQGIVNVVWADQTAEIPPGGDIFFTRSTDGGVGFSTPKNLSNNAVQSLSPRLASGSVNVVWFDANPPPVPGDIGFSRSADGVTFPDPVTLSADTAPPVSFRMDLDGEGKIHVLWSAVSTGSFNSDVFYIRELGGM